MSYALVTVRATAKDRLGELPQDYEMDVLREQTTQDGWFEVHGLIPDDKIEAARCAGFEITITSRSRAD